MRLFLWKNTDIDCAQKKNMHKKKKNTDIDKNYM